MAKGKRRRVDLDHYSAQDDNPAPAQETLERHTHFEPGRHRLSSRQQYISVPASPVKSRSAHPTALDEDATFRSEFYEDTAPQVELATLLDDVLAEDGMQLSGIEMLEQGPTRKRSLVSASGFFQL